VTSKTTSWTVNNCHIGALICSLGTLSLYVLTMAPTIQGFDSAELAVGAYTLGFVHPPGYPLYMLLGHLFAQIPIANVGLRLNLMSAIFGSLTALVLYQLLLAQTGEWKISLVATSLFATAPIPWSQAIQAEVYTLHTFLMASTLIAWFHAHRSMRIGSSVICFILLGLGMGNHLTTALLWASALISTIWGTPRWRRICISATILGLGIAAACYLYFPWRSMATPQIDYIRSYFDVDLGSLSGLWWLISASAFQHLFYIDLTPSALLQEVFRLSIFVWDGSLGIGLILGAWGWWRLRQAHPSWNLLLSLYFIANLIAFISYHVVDKEAMFIPTYLVGSIWIANGIGELTAWITSCLQRSNPDRMNAPISLILLLVIAVSVWLNWSSVSLRHDRRVYDFAARLLDEVEPSTTIVNHWVTASVLDYLQVVEGRRPDVTSFNLSFYFLGLQTRYGSLDNNNTSAQADWFSWLDSQLGQRPLCFIEPLPTIPDNLRWIRQNACWKLAYGEEE